jgi:hypothetical protein
MHKGDKGRCMQLGKGCKPLKASQKMPKSRCIDLERRRSLLSNWEGPYFFVEYKDGKGFQE